MHLGRFHAVISDLSAHFYEASLPKQLELCAAALDQFAQTRAQPQLEAFRAAYENLLKSAEVTNLELAQPYAKQIIQELAIDKYLYTDLSNTLQQILNSKSFDHAGIASDFRQLAAKIKLATTMIGNIYEAFEELNVEFERVSDEEAEVGVLLPREIVGTSLNALTTEFGKFGVLFRAINELTNATDYDPNVRTISSSWWQIFLDIDHAQIAVWIIAIERIVNLFKSNLEIKHLQQQLSEKQISTEITELIEKEIDKRISESLKSLASEIRKEHAQIDDEGRLNEVEIQLRQGLHHLAMRMNQGAQVEINVSIPRPMKVPKVEEGAELSQEMQDKIAAQRAKIAELRALQSRAQSASAETLTIDGNAQALLNYFSNSDKG